MNVIRIYAIALNTFREAVRDRILYGVLGGAFGVLGFTLALGELSLDQQSRVVTDIGLAATSLFAVLVAIFLGSSLLYKEIERKTLYVILPKPIRRHEFLLGKYFGIVLTGSVFVAIMGSILFWVVAIQAGVSPQYVIGFPLVVSIGFGISLWIVRDHTSVVGPWSGIALGLAMFIAHYASVDLQPLIASLVLMVGEILILTAVALVFSAFSSPFLTGLFSFGVWVIGRSADTMITVQDRIIREDIKRFLSALSEVAPNFNLYVPGYHALSLEHDSYGGPWMYVSTSMAYAVVYAVVLLLFASLIFRRRDFL